MDSKIKRNEKNHLTLKLKRPNHQPTGQTTMKNLLQSLWNKVQGWRLNHRFERCKKQAAQIMARVKAQYPNSEGIFAATDTWPPTSGISTGFVSKGKTTILWGTEGLLSSPYPLSGFYTVLRYTQRPIIERTK